MDNPLLLKRMRELQKTVIPKKIVFKLDIQKQTAQLSLHSGDFDPTGNHSFPEA